jgi:hypothetical protein
MTTSHLLLPVGAAPNAPARFVWLTRGGTDPIHQVLGQVLEHGRIQFIENLLTLAFGDHEATLAEDSQMARNRRPTGIEA